ncbi:hypothetical protein JCM8202_003126 [Rhodotorula sphaerocarpa]
MARRAFPRRRPPAVGTRAKALLQAAATAYVAFSVWATHAPASGRTALLVHAANAPAGGAGGGGGGGSSGGSGQACGWDYTCPQESPCCTEYGHCSAGVACLAGCNPQGSYGQGYCAPVPACQSANYTFADASRIQQNATAWDGDASKYDFTLDTLDGSKPSIVANDELILTLTENGGGTKVSTTRSVLYGTISASVKTVGAPGVVTAFITMSGVKDEIDIEWTTNDTSSWDSNWFWEGDVGNYDHGGTHKAKNRDEQYHVYSIDWTPSQLSWAVDGNTVRTIKKSNQTDQRFPQTPSRVQFSVWPAGIASSPQGTIDWAGGMIDWNNPTYVAQGHAFQAHVQWVDIQCYSGSDLNLPFTHGNDSSSSGSNSSRRARERRNDLLWPRAQNINSYIYGTNDTQGQIGVSGSDAQTIINSAYSTGHNMIISNGDTKGVKQGVGSGALAKTVVGNWWQRQNTGIHVGIIIAGCLLVLFLIVVCCTAWARRGRTSRRARDKAAILAAAAGPSSKGGAGGGGFGAPGRDTVPLVQHDNRSFYSDSIKNDSAYSLPGGGGGGGGGRAGYDRNGGRTPPPPVPTLPKQYSDFGAPSPGPRGGYASPQQQQGGRGTYPPPRPQQQQHQQQQQQQRPRGPGQQPAAGPGRQVYPGSYGGRI